MRIPRFMLNQFCTIIPYQGTTPEGPAYGDNYEARCRVEETKSVVRDAEGKEIICGRVVYLDYTELNSMILIGSKIIFDGTESFVGAISKKAGLSPSHIVCATYTSGKQS